VNQPSIRPVQFDQPALLTRFDPENRRSRYFDLLMDENRQVNLVSRETSRADLERIYAECLHPLTVLSDSTPSGRFLDIGSGGGFPLVPMAVAAEFTETIALERTRKKALALERILNGLDLPAGVIARNLPEAGLSGTFDLITLRYVALTTPLWQQISGLLSPGGLFVHYGRSDLELPESSRTVWSFQTSPDQPVKHFSVVSHEN
jgi:16S rRNA (guanine527-N7)-methyltransferase